MSRTRGESRRLDLAIAGTRGIPANYGGFETFAEELAVRLVERGHRVTVYGRPGFVERSLGEYRGVRIRVLPAWRHKYLETVSHAACTLLVAARQSHDLILLCNAANAFLAWIPGLAGQKLVLNVDGIERQRRKWNWLGRSFYRFGEFLSTQLPDHMVSDARCIQQYYRQEYGADSAFIAYGASVEQLKSRAQLDELRIAPGRYLLYVSRLEPENNAHRVIGAYLASGVDVPLVVLGDAPYADRYIAYLRELAQRGNVIMPGALYGTAYRELLAHCLCYVQATEVGGTHPALLEAMGAARIVLANDTPEHREVVGDTALIYPFNDTEALGRLIQRVCRRPEEFQSLGEAARRRVSLHYDWERVVDRYEDLFDELVDANS